jgi:hypothetical protein
VDANAQESKEVFLFLFCCSMSILSSRLQTIELTADKLDQLIQSLTQLQQALHSVV